MPAFSVRERVTASASRSPWCRSVPGSAHWGPLDSHGPSDEKHGQPKWGSEWFGQNGWAS